MKGQIEIVKKPDSISFNDIHEILYEANEQNRKDGFILNTSLLSGKELEARLGDKGCCFVAIKEGKLVGTASIRVVKRNTWYAKGDIADYMLVGIRTEYQGQHISTMLEEAAVAYTKELGLNAIELDTAENNKKAIHIYSHQGYHPVTCRKFSHCDHYSIVMLKWLEKIPYPMWYANCRYHLKKMIVHLKSND